MSWPGGAAVTAPAMHSPAPHPPVPLRPVPPRPVPLPPAPVLPLTRAAALERLAAFVPRAGAEYAARRNRVDPGGDHAAVSRLSAALRRRVIGEDEAVRAVLAAHGLHAAEKFIAEVFWRTYWKGWLEQRPAQWAQWRAQTAHLRADPAVARACAPAMAGQTGIAAFDHWAHELARTGYLHNWARMQVASIWVFTLRLPWQLGAAWMFERLHDADPAANTLSWRWVAGLHTPGKAYLADPARIAAMTGGALHAQGLAAHADIPPADPPLPTVEPRHAAPVDPAAPTLLLITPEDCALETVLGAVPVRAVAHLPALATGAADRTACDDALARAARHWGVPVIAAADAAALVAAARAQDCTQVATGFAPVGPVAAALDRLRAALDAAGLPLAEHRRPWDALAWPHCRKGFFQLRSRIPDLLAQQGLA